MIDKSRDFINWNIYPKCHFRGMSPTENSRYAVLYVLFKIKYAGYNSKGTLFMVWTTIKFIYHTLYSTQKDITQLQSLSPNFTNFVTIQVFALLQSCVLWVPPSLCTNGYFHTSTLKIYVSERLKFKHLRALEVYILLKSKLHFYWHFRGRKAWADVCL